MQHTEFKTERTPDSWQIGTAVGSEQRYEPGKITTPYIITTCLQPSISRENKIHYLKSIYAKGYDLQCMCMYNKQLQFAKCKKQLHSSKA